MKGNAEYKFSNKTSIRDIDEIIHRERINKDGLKNTYEENNKNLPDGTFIIENHQPYLVLKKQLHLWNPFGYTERKSFKLNGKSMVLTPKSIVNAFKAGYIPQIKIKEERRD